MNAARCGSASSCRRRAITSPAGDIPTPSRAGPISSYEDIAATAERGKFDMFFLATASPRLQQHPSTIGKSGRSPAFRAGHDTSRLGLAATASTTYAEPYHVAAASPRSTTCPAVAAWNVVTTAYANQARCSAASTRHTPSAMRWRRSSSKPVGCCGTAGTTMRSSPTRRPGAWSGRQPPCARFQGQVLRGRRRAERTAAAARPSGADPGGLLRPGPGAGRAHRRRGVLRAEREDRGAGLLHGIEAQLSIRPAGGERLDHAGVFPVIGGTDARRRRSSPSSTEDRHGAGLHGAVRPAGHRHVGISAGRSGACPARDRASQEPRGAPAGDGPARNTFPAAALLRWRRRAAYCCSTTLAAQTAGTAWKLAPVGCCSTASRDTSPPSLPGQSDDFIDGASGILLLLQEARLFRARL